jgi:hypothetical protein
MSPPFVFSHVTKNWKEYWKKKTYKEYSLIDMLDKIHLKKVVSSLNTRTPTLYYHGEIDKCPSSLLSRKDIIIKRLEGKGQVYECNSKNPKTLQKSWRREKVIIESHISHFKNPSSYPIPFDYKIYTFKGDPKYVLIINRNDKKGNRSKKGEETHLLLEANTMKDVTHLMGDSRHHGKPFPKIKCKEDAIPSKEVWDTLIKTAIKLGKTVFPEVFVRLDFFIDETSPVLCEISPSPRGHWFWWFHQARNGDKKDKPVWVTHPDKYRMLDRLCMEYKIKPSWL